MVPRRERPEIVPYQRDQSAVDPSGCDEYPESSAAFRSEFYCRRRGSPVWPNLDQGHDDFRPSHSGAAEFPGYAAPLVLARCTTFGGTLSPRPDLTRVSGGITLSDRHTSCHQRYPRIFLFETSTFLLRVPT